jgi:hypothetical protein
MQTLLSRCDTSLENGAELFHFCGIFFVCCGFLQALGRNKGGAGAGARGGIAAPTKAGAAALGVSPSKLINRSKSAINPSRGKEVDPYQNIKEKGGAWKNFVCFLCCVVS